MPAHARSTVPAGERPHTPSSNRHDPDPSRPDTPDAVQEGREANGRFAKGNKGGPGNPFARQVAGLRQALLDVVTEEDMEAVARELVRQAREGNLGAIKLLLSYTVGRPAEAVDPDQLDVEEWQLYRRGAEAGPQLPETMRSMPVELACHLQRTTRPGMADVYRNGLLDGLRALEQQDAQAQHQDEPAEGAEGEDADRGPAADDTVSPGMRPREARGSGAGSTSGVGAGLPRGLSESEWLAGLGLHPTGGVPGNCAEQEPSPNGGHGRGTGRTPSPNGRNGRGEGGAKR